jgi:hypothetical protein
MNLSTELAGCLERDLVGRSEALRLDFAGGGVAVGVAPEARNQRMRLLLRGILHAANFDRLGLISV